MNAAKAAVSGVIAGLSSAAATTGAFTRGAVIQDVLAAVVAFNATYFVPNRPARPAPAPQAAHDA